MDFEFTVLDFIQNHLRSDIADQIMLFFTRLGDAGFIWILLAVMLLVFPKTRKIGVVLIVALVVDLVLCNIILKPIVARIRPYDVHAVKNMLVARQYDYSFPSGHTAAGFTCVMGLYLTGKKKWSVIAFVLATIIAFSRLYVYVHYPTDVLAGVAVGVVCGYCGYKLVTVFGKAVSRRTEGG